MRRPRSPLALLTAIFAGWVNRRQRVVIDYLLEENRILREKLGQSQLQFSTRSADVWPGTCFVGSVGTVGITVRSQSPDYQTRTHLAENGWTQQPPRIISPRSARSMVPGPGRPYAIGTSLGGA